MFNYNIYFYRIQENKCFFVEKVEYLTYNLVRGELMAINWFIAFIILIIVELVTVNLVTIWFAIGSVFSMIVSFYTDSLVIQLIVFIIVSLFSLLITKPLIKKLKAKEVVPTNSDRVIGHVAIVTKEISKDKYGEVKVLGNTWTASCDESIEVGKKVRIKAIDGVKLIVKLEEE